MIQRVAIVLLLAGACLAQDTVARMDEVAQSFVASKVFMGSVLVARDGNILFSKGYGSANLEWNIPNSPSTKFRLGSVTKQFTAACILLLEQRGQLKVLLLLESHPIPRIIGQIDHRIRATLAMVFHRLPHQIREDVLVANEGRELPSPIAERGGGLSPGQV